MRSMNLAPKRSMEARMRGTSARSTPVPTIISAPPLGSAGGLAAGGALSARSPLFGGLRHALVMFGPALLLCLGDAPAHRRAEHALYARGLLCGRHDRLPLKLRLNFANLVFDLFFLDLITNQRHFQRGQVFYVASCHGFTPAHYNIKVAL